MFLQKDLEIYIKKKWYYLLQVLISLLPEQKCAVNMNYGTGITLTGSAGIQINTANLMRLEANKIVFQATDRIMANTPKANVIVDEIMHFKA